jgi:hypothetical protein
MLFSSPPVIKLDPEPGEKSPYAKFKEDCDGNGTDIECFFASRFVEAMVKRRAYWRIDFGEGTVEPGEREVATAAEVANRMAPRLVALCPEQIINWHCDEDGEFLWVLEHRRDEALLELEDNEATVTETWTRWYADHADRWEISYLKSDPPPDDAVVTRVAAPKSYGQIPIKFLELPEELWLMNVLADAQLEHFRVQNALAHFQRNCAFAMPVFHLKSKKNPPKMGAGYYIALGIEESVDWTAPPVDVMAALEARLVALKDEMHRIAQQMARGVENNAAAVGRSGESKKADASATEQVLAAYGIVVCEAMESTMTDISRARSEDLDVSVTGMDTYDLADAQTFISNALATDEMAIGSVTYLKEKHKKLVRAELAHLPEDKLKQIDDEIEKSTTQDQVDAKIMGGMPGMMPPGGAGKTMGLKPTAPAKPQQADKPTSAQKPNPATAARK